MIHQMAPWVPQFIQSWKNHSQPFAPFTFATLDMQSNRPKCRTVIFRDFLFHDKRSNVLTFTTDMRGDKVKEILGSGAETAPFEACFYFPSSWEQYRFSGKCFVVSRQSKPLITHTFNGAESGAIEYPILSPSIYGDAHVLYQHEHVDESEDEHVQNDEEHNGTSADNETEPDVASVRPELSRTSTRSSGPAAHHAVLTPAEYAPPTPKEWDLELARQWADLSRSTKAQFRKPHPGTPVTSETSKQLDKIQRGVDGAKENTGFDNFGVVCLCIDEVDFLNLKDGRGGERWKFRRHVEEDSHLESWIEEEVCP
ncbi:uncharacterized protein KLTH0H08998g [Lachancea thermotolerans CBS 6340]|uniref:KLTH0H08998p n=1 Tax=Lachancea thermotolerans (strain ATCC 56472 / CBS 6340 / NRRL Y-8284) TaxID=559295 RepID=C5E2Z2_LACTC|nr:KLTH0H08998p [Lachancea thermotolerans CBS 6340]CAR30403.1 KLTH0H08998p [Lachancea thermotolerans CBS 6340]